jgi:hypothetical protein
MGCNCKKTYDKLKKVADNREEIEEEENEINQNIVNRVASFISQIAFGIIAAFVFIIVVIPLVLYITGCIILGKDPTVKIINPNNIFKKKDAR